MKRIASLLALALLSCADPSEVHWEIGPFSKLDNLNPVLHPISETLFFCPVRRDSVAWELKDVFNPSAVVKDDTLFMLYRAEDSVGIYNGTSRIGLAWSLDGTSFSRESTPVFYPDNDPYRVYEWEGGIEDPRITESEGIYYMTYSSYDGEVARLCVASSEDLRHWTKYGPAFDMAAYPKLWSKSGSIVSSYQKGTPVAETINGSYWMYWGDTDIFLATSSDLIHWEPLEADGQMRPILSPRKGMFDSRLVEPGPPALLTQQGIVLIYNGMNLAPDNDGDLKLKEGTYSGGQALFSTNDPTEVINRTEHYFITPEQNYEITGQIGNVCFVEGLVQYKNKWHLFYGTADSKIAMATAPVSASTSN